MLAHPSAFLRGDEDESNRIIVAYTMGPDGM